MFILNSLKEAERPLFILCDTDKQQLLKSVTLSYIIAAIQNVICGLNQQEISVLRGYGTGNL